MIAMGRVAYSIDNNDNAAMEKYTRSSVREALNMKRSIDRKAVVFAGKLLNRTLAGMATEEELSMPTAAAEYNGGDPTTFRSQMIRTFVQQQKKHIRDSMAFLKLRSLTSPSESVVVMAAPSWT